jgi:hypothetical protein
MSDTALLDPQARDKLIKLLKLLGSQHDGERASAGKMAHELLRQLGLSWSEVIAQPNPFAEFEANSKVYARRRNGSQDDSEIWDQKFDLLRAHRDQLNEWEKEFLGNAERYRHHLTPKQQAIVDRLVKQVRRCN